MDVDLWIFAGFFQGLGRSGWINRKTRCNFLVIDIKFLTSTLRTALRLTFLPKKKNNKILCKRICIYIMHKYDWIGNIVEEYLGEGKLTIQREKIDEREENSNESRGIKEVTKLKK